MKVDLKNKFERYLPSLFLLIEGDFGWTSINKSFVRNFKKYKQSYDNEEKPRLKRNIYDIISGAIEGNKQDLAYHFYLDNLFKNLSLRLDQNGKRWINKNLKDLLLWEGFLETLGELSVLINLMDTKIYRLIETEAVNGIRNKGSEKKPGIDFKLKNTETGNDLLIEIVNIELKDENSSNNLAINQLLTSKLQEKIKTTNQSGLDYLLIPVLYYEKIDLLKRVEKFYEDNNFKIKYVEAPRAFVLAYDESFQHFKTRFGLIHTVLKTEILKDNN